MTGTRRASRVDGVDTTWYLRGMGKPETISKLDQLKVLGEAKRSRADPQPARVTPGGCSTSPPSGQPIQSLRGGGESRPADRTRNSHHVGPPQGTVGAVAAQAGVAPGPRKATLNIDWSQCPVCAARRMAKKAAMKKWRKKTIQEIRKD